MKKTFVFLSSCIVAVSTPLFATSNSATSQESENALIGQMQGQNMNQMPDCSNLTPSEQNFANQLRDMNNRTMFCGQFTAQQRQQSMQMAGQVDASGNTMTADQSVQQVMQSNGMSPMMQRGRSTGGCPVK